MDQVWGEIAKQGALVLSFATAIYFLWKALKAAQEETREVRAFYEGEPAKGDKDAKPGKVAELQAAAQKREDKIRTDFDKKEKELRAELAAVYKELNDTLRGEFED